MLVDLFVFAVGLVVLVVGAEALIRGSVGVATRLGISPFVIGLTLVGLGPTAPELVVNLSAALADAPDLATGNVVGSNIANVGLILGVGAIVSPLAAKMRLLKLEIPAVIGVSLLLWALAADGTLDRRDAAVLLTGLALTLAAMGIGARRESRAVKAEIADQPEITDTPGRLWIGLLQAVIGLVLLVVGAELLVRAAVSIARDLGVSELVIGLTVLAIGTSLPELASTIAAALRGQADIAVGNVVGSNLFNVLLILGATAAVTPLPVSPPLVAVDLPVMTGFAVLLWLVLANGLVVRRWEGGLLLAAYAGFIAWQCRAAVV
jgi:cation:H+ antiporter